MTASPHGGAQLALRLTNIDKRFDGVQALDAAHLDVKRGTIHAVLGENGAGKTTLLRIAYGIVRPDAGTITINGVTRSLGSPADAIACGLGMVHQHFTLVPVMTVAENIALGGRRRLDRGEVIRRVRTIGEQTGFALDPLARVESLSVSAQQRVEIAKALSREAGVLILDEPTAVLAPAESTELLRWLRRYVEAGNAAVLITHKLREALAVADDVTVLRHGHVVLTAAAGSVTSASLTEAMLGEDTDVDDTLTAPVSSESSRLHRRTTSTRPESNEQPRVVFDATGLTVTDVAGIARLRDASFSIAEGEIVGIAGVDGSGHRELLRAIAGRARAVTGSLRRPSSVGFIPEDRHHDAVLLDRSLAENVALRGAGDRRGIIDWADVRRETETMMRTFDVRAPSARVIMRTLSGGNQQKLVLARELEVNGAAEPYAIVAENPTRGLDVRATAEVHARLCAARDAGAAIVMYSSDIDEVLLLATRVLVTYAGAVREVACDRESIGRAMLGLG